MFTTATISRASEARPGLPRRQPKEITGHFEERITGRYRTIPAKQLALAWWCFMEGHITRRALRVYFAAHEMAEQRCYGRTRSSREKPVYRADQVQHLIGGSNSERSARKLSSDMRQLAALGLVTIETHSIRFTNSIDTLTVGEGESEAFATFLATIPNRSRIVPVPRRMLRALAAGFGKAQTAYIIGALICSVFWHRSSGLYRVDGRMKGSWLAKTFGISRAAVTQARAHLIELGWLRPLEVPWWAAQKYGVHDVVNVHWSPSDAAEASTETLTDLPPDSVDNTEAIEEIAAPESGSRLRNSAPQSGSPCLNRSLSTRSLNTRRLGTPPDHPDLGDRKKKNTAPPTIRDVKLHDLRDTDRLMELHRQAVTLGLARGGEAGMLDFLSLANRARMRGKSPGALFVWLLREKKTAFITAIDEEAGAQRLREHHNGSCVRSSTHDGTRAEQLLSAEEQSYENCIHAARKHRIRDPYRVAQQVLNWSREQWEVAKMSYDATQARHWIAVEDSRSN